MSIDFNLLSGPQLAILRESLISAYRRDDFDTLLYDRGFGPLENHAKSANFPRQVFELIDSFTRKGIMNNLMTHVLADNGKAPALRDLTQKLLLTKPEPNPPKPLDLEKLVRDSGYADLNLWASNLVKIGARVCRVSYLVRGEVCSGTGFLVGPDLVLTNYHVIEPLIEQKASFREVKCNFGFAEFEQGLSSGEVFNLADQWLVASSPYSQADTAITGSHPAENELDFALLRLSQAAGEVKVGQEKRGWVSLPDPPSETTGIVFILQHPRGNPLKLSSGLLTESPSSLRLRYDADTGKGSSGSLVVTHNLDPIALHHAGDPQTKIKAQFNQGIPLARIKAMIEGQLPGLLS